MTLPAIPGSADTVLSGVSCVTTSFCVAVGQATGPKPVIEQWNGSAWTVASTSLGESLGMDGVSCTSLNFCEAVGFTDGFVGPRSPPSGTARRGPSRT